MCIRDRGPPGPRGRIVVLTSDHGEEFLEHGGLEHGHSFYQEVLAVPLVVSGVAADNRLGTSAASRVVGVTDIAPALLEAAGGPRSPLSEAYVSQNPIYGPPPEYSERDPSAWAVREGDWKLIRHGPGPEVYDLAEDPGERSDLAEEAVERLKELDRHEPGPALSGAASATPQTKTSKAASSVFFMGDSSLERAQSSRRP